MNEPTTLPTHSRATDQIDLHHLNALRNKLLRLGEETNVDDLLEFFDSASQEMRSMASRVASSESVRRHFISNVRNEINNPITAITGLSSKLSIQQFNDLDRARTIARLINKEALSLSFHLENVFAAGELEAGTVALQWEAVYLPDAVAAVTHALQSQLNEKAINIHVANQSNGDTVVTDAGKLRIILMNLISNAIKFSQPGNDIVVTLNGGGFEKSFSIEIRDNGQGIKEGELHKIYERFAQMDTGTTKSYAGLGLGLTLVKGFIDLLCGQIHAKSKEGVGSTFTLHIPCPLDKDILDDDALGDDDIFFGEEELF